MLTNCEPQRYEVGLNEAVETRQAVMEIIKWNLGPMVGMVKEEIPFDAERFALGAERIAMAGSMIADASRVDTREATAHTEALPKIWDEFDEYEELADNLDSRIVLEGWQNVANDARVNISPCTDDRPFIGQMGRWANFKWKKLERLS